MIEYTCDCCHQTFEKSISDDEEAAEEFNRDFPKDRLEDSAEVCDDCYRLLQKCGTMGIDSAKAGGALRKTLQGLADAV